jgi:hypothetical protein
MMRKPEVESQLAPTVLLRFELNCVCKRAMGAVDLSAALQCRVSWPTCIG